MDMDKCYGMMEKLIKANGLMEYKKMLKLNLIIILRLIIDIIHLVIDNLFKNHLFKIIIDEINYLE